MCNLNSTVSLAQTAANNTIEDTTQVTTLPARVSTNPAEAYTSYSPRACTRVSIDESGIHVNIRRRPGIRCYLLYMPIINTLPNPNDIDESNLAGKLCNRRPLSSSPGTVPVAHRQCSYGYTVQYVPQPAAQL